MPGPAARLVQAQSYDNSLDGLPFFKINLAVDPGLIRAIEEQIVPELERLVPNQLSQAGAISHAPRRRIINNRPDSRLT